MATQADVRRLALALPGTVEASNDFAFCVMVKGKPKPMEIVHLDPSRIDVRVAALTMS